MSMKHKQKFVTFIDIIEFRLYNLGISSNIEKYVYYIH